jgi:hypothetical protein
MDAASFLDIVRCNSVNAALLDRLPALDLPQCHLTAGCLFQAVWNRLSGLPEANAIKDYDIFYFDPDTSWEAEDAIIRRVNDAFADLAVGIEVKNQARVHLWYAQRFGSAYPRLLHVRDGIDRYLISCTCIGIEIASGKLYAPHGFDELERGILRMNPLSAQPQAFRDKAQSYRKRWPWLSVVD